MKAYKVTWQTLKNSTNYLAMTVGNIETIAYKEEYFITKEAALEFIEIKDKALRELQLNLGQLQMPILYEVELK